MIGQSEAKDSLTVPPGLKVLTVQADTAEYPLGNMLRCVSYWDETYCVLMALHHVYRCVNWIYVCNVSFVMMLLYMRISCLYFHKSQRKYSKKINILLPIKAKIFPHTMRYLLS